MAEEYTVAIKAPINGVDAYFYLDTCTARTLTSHATIAQFPVQSGETISDHMYRDAQNLELSGKFSNQGSATLKETPETAYNKYSWQNKNSNIDWQAFYSSAEGKGLNVLDGLDRMARIQTLFEWIQAKGVLCDIMLYNKSSQRGGFIFKERKNMALENIRWTEGINGMDYSFTFKEILSVNPYESFGEFDYNSEYPNTTMPAVRSMSELVKESGDYTELLVRTLVELEILDYDDLKTFTKIFKNSDLKTTASLKILVDAINKMTSEKAAYYTGFFIPRNFKEYLRNQLYRQPVVLGILTSTTIVRTIFGNKSKKKNSEYLGAIKLIEKGLSNNIDQTNLGRLQTLIEDIKDAIDNALSEIKVYDLTNLEINSTKAILYENEYPIYYASTYILVGADLLKITLESVQNKFSPYIAMVDMDGNTISPKYGWSVIKSPLDMDPNSNMIYRDSSRNYQLYLYDPILDDEDVDVKDRLKSYYFIVAHGDAKNQLNKVEKSIANVLKNRGYAE